MPANITPRNRKTGWKNSKNGAEIVPRNTSAGAGDGGGAGGRRPNFFCCTLVPPPPDPPLLLSPAPPPPPPCPFSPLLSPRLLSSPFAPHPFHFTLATYTHIHTRTPPRRPYPFLIRSLLLSSPLHPPFLIRSLRTPIPLALRPKLTVLHCIVLSSHTHLFYIP